MISFKEKQRTLFERQEKLRKNPTRSELILRERLENSGVRFIFQKCFIAKDYYCIVDFYLPKPHKICIEVDGGYHYTLEQIEKDKRRTTYLTEKRGFKVIRIGNENVSSFDITQFF